MCICAICVYVYMCVYIHTHTYTYIYVYVCIDIYSMVYMQMSRRVKCDMYIPAHLLYHSFRNACMI